MSKATEKKEQKQQQEPAMFNIVGQFAKDISLECPIPPFTKDAEGLGLQMDVGVAVRTLDKAEGHHEVVIKLRGEALNDKKKTCYLAEVEYAGVFVVKNVDEKQVKPLLSIDGAALIFPFARQAFMDVVGQAGYHAPMLAPVNFHAMYVQNSKTGE